MIQPVLAIGLERLRRGDRDTPKIAAEGNGEGPRGLLQANAERILIDNLDLGDILVIRAHPRLDLRVQNAVDIPLRRRGIEIRTIVEFNAFFEVEDVCSA